MRKRVLTNQVGVVLSEEMHHRLIEITDKLEIPISQFIRNIVEKELTKINKEAHKDE
jgi:predicted DNA-binding protein